MLDVTALVLSRRCLNELLRAPEPLVVSTAYGIPTDFEATFGCVANTGALRLRRDALTRNFSATWAAVMAAEWREDHGESDQEHFNHLLRNGSFGWEDPGWGSGDREGRVGSFVAASDGGGGNASRLRVRFLGPLRWPRDASREEAARQGLCLYHPYEHDDRVGRFRRDGFWHDESSARGE